MITTENLTKVNRDVNGNPRYVTHFLNIITDKDKEQLEEDFKLTLQQNPFKRISLLYALAVSKAKKIGGKKYKDKDFWDGIVFQSYNTNELVKELNELNK